MQHNSLEKFLAYHKISLLALLTTLTYFATMKEKCVLVY